MKKLMLIAMLCLPFAAANANSENPHASGVGNSANSQGNTFNVIIKQKGGGGVSLGINDEAAVPAASPAAVPAAPEPTTQQSPSAGGTEEKKECGGWWIFNNC